MRKARLHGIHKSLFLLRVKLHVLFHYFVRFLKNGKAREFFFTLKRLNCFLGKFAHHKFAQVGDKIRLDMYVPGFPSRAFFTACDKFAVFHAKPPSVVALISVTSACTYHCAHCYQRLDLGGDVDLDKLLAAVKQLQDSGVAFFNIEGGEPFLTPDRLLALCQQIDDRSEIWVNTTGNRVTRELLAELKKTSLTVIMFSLHSAEEEKFNAFMGDPNAWQTMVAAIGLCHEAGIPVAFNSCLLLEDFTNGNFEKVMLRAKSFGAVLLQLIKPKPSGAWLACGVEEYSAPDFALVKGKVDLFNQAQEYVDYPAISAQIIEEDPQMFGCTAGGTDRVYINAKGDVQPCEFLNISFGNIAEEDFAMIYQRMREVFKILQTTIICEKHSRDVHRIYVENHLSRLPLPKDLSQQVCAKMTHDSPTPLYEQMEKYE